jgi:Sulfotransferase domain
MIDGLWDRFVREATVRACFFLPAERRQRIERRARGREEARKLARADYVVVSYGKSGRTWLRVMLSRYFQIHYGLDRRRLLGFDNYRRQNPSAPAILFTHDNYLRDYTGHRDSKADFRTKKVILLVRHPADTAISQFFQWRYRMLPRKKALNEYPAHGSDISVAEFVLHHQAGLERVIGFMNEWAGEVDGMERALVVRYEDLRRAPSAVLRQVLIFMGERPGEDELAEAVAFGSVENMRKLEEQSVFWRSGRVLRPGRRDNPDSYKVRRAKVGGYRDYFDDAGVAEVDQAISARLSPLFGYGVEQPCNPGRGSEEVAAVAGARGDLRAR